MPPGRAAPRGIPRPVGSAAMTEHICVTCGTQFAPTERPPPSCPICDDPRQYVPPSGQAWTTLGDLAADHANVLRDDGGLTGIISIGDVVKSHITQLEFERDQLEGYLSG